MATFNVTASGNFDNKKAWSGLKKHLEHDPKLKHKNEYLNTDESKALRKYNSHEVLIDYDKFCEDNFTPYVKDHDAHMKDKRRKFGSVKRFLKVDAQGKRRELQPAQAYVEKLSDEEHYKQYLKTVTKFLMTKGYAKSIEQAKDIALRVTAKGLARYADGFNKRNTNIKMFEYYVHMDEKGSAHLHSQVMPIVIPQGKTKSGHIKKPSWSLNRALTAQYGNAGMNKQNLKTFRKQEDTALINAMNDELTDELHVKPVFALVRKTDKDKTLKTGISHDVYVAKQQALEDINKQIKTKQKTLASQNAQIATLNTTQRDLKNKLEDTTKEQENAEKAKNDALKRAEQAEKRTKQAQTNLQSLITQENHKKENELNDRKAKLDKRQERYNNWLDSYKKAKSDVAKRERHVVIREKKLDQREHALDDRETSLNSWATDLNAKENGGLDSKGVKHKSIEERIRDGIRAGMQKVLHPLKAFRHGYLNSLIRQQLAGVDERQIKEIVKQQETSYGKEAMVAALSGVSGKAVQHQAVKAVGAGALAMAKDMPKYKDVSDAVAYTAQVQDLEKEDERRRRVSKHVESNKDITDTF